MKLNDKAKGDIVDAANLVEELGEIAASIRVDSSDQECWDTLLVRAERLVDEWETYTRPSFQSMIDRVEELEEL